MHQVEDEVTAVFETGVVAWNQGDLDGYLATYAAGERPTYISGGRVVRGFDAIAKRYRSRFDTPAAMGALELVGLDIDILSAESALVIGQFQHHSGHVTTNGTFTVIVGRINGSWQIVHDHASANPSDQ